MTTELTPLEQLRAKPKVRYARRGRPPKFDIKTLIDQAGKLAMLGLTDEKMAEVFNVAPPTFCQWKQKHPKLAEAIVAGRELAAGNVARSLYERACGYSHPAVKIMIDKGKVIRERYTEHYPPDTAAGIFWLKNRVPDLWRDKVETQVTGENPLVAVLAMIDGKTKNLVAQPAPPPAIQGSAERIEEQQT